MKTTSLQPYQSAMQQLFGYMNAYCGITKEQFKQLSGYFIVRKLDKKSLLIQPGEVDHYFNYILTGIARKYVLAGKKEITLQLSTEGHFIHAELSFHTGKPADCFVEAIEATTFLAIHKEDLEKLFIEIPILNKLARLMVSEMYIRKELRDLSHLRLTARDRFFNYMHKHPDMMQRVSQKYIASYLNIKPETFSRLKHLIRQRK
ncbi:Crp/Fnr family transcriptional regulator [Flavihumibacter sp. UBA7668]|uniref:Crp/Fnr family transcriptional regulator n=1 Tax=Flavihumibacter sp. UBA7668 TaxID=1946542 RepID=UPI0025B7A9F2|nr:Crp/Fnr family transcriptional regulator [Flavihumibacter sp. UBA7668]